jgi:hypothetical protein
MYDRSAKIVENVCWKVDGMLVDKKSIENACDPKTYRLFLLPLA